MRILFLLFFIFNLTIFLHADWKWVSGGSFNDVNVVSNNEIWFAGELLVKGVKDKSGNWTWEQEGKQITDKNSISKINFYDSSHGIAFNENYIFYTQDGGNSWTTYSMPKNYSIYDIYMVGEKTAYACGQENTHEGQGVILKTIDAGKTWTLLYKTDIYFGGSFTQIKMFSSTEGIAIGTFYDGWGSFGALYKTEDNWKTANVIHKSNTPLWGFSAPTDKDIYVRGGETTSSPYIAYTHGGNWLEVKLDDDITGIFDLAFDSKNHGYAVGHYDSQPGTVYEEYGAVILETSDGGKTWKRTNFVANNSALTEEKDKDSTDVEFFNSIAIAGGDIFLGQNYLNGVYPCENNNVCTGKILYQKSEGNNWELLDKLSGYSYTKVKIFDTINGGVKGLLTGYDIFNNQSFVRHFEDNILKTPHFFEYTCSFLDFDFVNQNEGWGAYCRNNDYTKMYLLYTSNGGDSWSKKEINYNDTLVNSVKVKVNSNGDVILYVGKSMGDYILKDVFSTPEKLSVYGTSLNYLSDGSIYLIASGVLEHIDNSNNKNYPEIGSDKYAQFLNIQFVNDNVGFALRNNDYAIFRTTDGGKSWLLTGKAPIKSSTGFIMKFIDETHGYLVKGNILNYTDDAGATWNEMSDGVNPGSISGIDASEKLKGIAFSPSGMVIENLNGESSYSKNYCGSFDENSYSIYIPCITVGNPSFVGLFSLRYTSPEVLIELKDIGFLLNSNSNKQCATFNPDTGIFHVPCFILGDKSYSLDFNIKYLGPPIQLKLIKIMEN